MKCFKYKDWLTSKVVLKYDFFIPKGENPLLVGWDSFTEHDMNLIKDEQRRIFEESIQKLFLKYTTHFLDNYSRSLKKEICISNEIHQCEEILKSKVSPRNSQYFKTTYWNVLFLIEDIIKIQAFYLNNIIRGTKFELDFIHPENSKFQKPGFVHESVYCYTLLKYKDWLCTNFFQKNQIQDSTTYSESKKDTVLGTSIKNHFSDLKNEFNNQTDYEDAIRRIEEYFSGNVNLTEKTIFIRKGNIKSLAYSLGEIWKENSSKSISYEYLHFCKSTFTVFYNQKISKKKCFASNLYKYMIS